MDIVIIGGGASGLMTAITLKNKTNKVTIVERNDSCGKKILMTGNGRCNYWNSNMSLDNYHTSNKELLKKIITPENCLEVLFKFKELGIIPRIKDGYYYPSSNQALSIKKSLLNEAKNKGIIIKTNFLVTKVKKVNDKFKIISKEETITSDYLVVATGGKAAPKTGSTGTGYDIAQEFNHTIIKPLPALVQLKANYKFLKDWDGVRANVSIYLREDGNIISKEEGEIQLTDYGVSGICVFNLSSIINKGLDKDKKEELLINFIPFIKGNPLNWLKDRANLLPNLTVLEELELIINNKLAKVILTRSNINYQTYFKDLSLEQISTLLKNLTNFEIIITGTNDFTKAQVTSGGVPLTEVNPNTLESLKCPNLYFTGELLDVDGNCGGYNLGFSWISGIIVGNALKEK